jgi:hypothetical protein
VAGNIKILAFFTSILHFSGVRDDLLGKMNSGIDRAHRTGPGTSVSKVGTDP